MWAVGCIIYEMLTNLPLFPGSSPTEQLKLIFQKLGTPNVETHPELKELPGFKKCRNFRQHSPKSLICLPRLDTITVDLLLKLLKVILIKMALYEFDSALEALSTDLSF